MTSAQQRVQQGIRALLAISTAVDLNLAKQHLSTTEFEAFYAMSRAEQLHSLNVLRDVLAQSEHTPHSLAVAALLHDVGKSRYHLAVWQKTIAVLMTAFLPKLAHQLSCDETLSFWRAPYIVRAFHAKWGADILISCDADDTTIWLVEHHQDDPLQYIDHPDYDLLCRLQSADDAN